MRVLKRFFLVIARSPIGLCAWILLVCAGAAAGADGQRFPILNAGAQTFSNAVIVSQNTNDVYISHAAGFANVKVRDLDPEVQEQLGFVIEAIKPAEPVSIAERLHLDPEIVAAEAKFQEGFQKLLTWITPAFIAGVLAVLLLIHLFFSYCSKQICVKAGHVPGALVWIPLFQWIPLFKAAGMGGLWFVLFILPPTSWLAAIVWAFKIATARGKSWFTGLMLLLPVTNLLAFLYLAFSQSVQEEALSAPAPGELVLR